MLQSYTCSFIPPVKSPLQWQGYVGQLKLPAKQIEKCKHLKNSNFSKRKTIIRSKLLESHSREHWNLSIPKKNVIGSIQREVFKKWDIFYRFTHPYAVLATIIGVPSVCLLPLQSTADLSLPVLVGVLKALVPALLMNIYSGGINHLFDVEIDKVNKPDRPLVTGELSIKSGIVIVSTSLAMSLGIGFMFQSPPLLCGLLVYFAVASAYSIELPLLRWKGNPILAAVAILIMRGLLHVPYYIHIQKYVLSRPFVITRSLVFAVSILSLFSVSLALLKDVPDVDGDKEHGVQSFSVIAGKEKVFWLGISMLLTGYASAVVVGASTSCFTNRLVTVSSHAVLALSLWHRARSTDLDSKASIASLYMFLWKSSTRSKIALEKRKSIDAEGFRQR